MLYICTMYTCTAPSLAITLHSALAHLLRYGFRLNSLPEDFTTAAKHAHLLSSGTSPVAAVK